MTRTTAPTRAASDIRVLNPGDIAAATAVLARGFAEEPGNLALYPDPVVRRAVWDLGARDALAATLPLGTAHAAFVGDDLAAIALWHPPGVRATAPALRRLRLLAGADVATIVRGVPHAASVLLPAGRRAMAMARARRGGIARAARGACWHLAFLATIPEHRGKGLARALLDRQLTRCDQDGAAIWLETTDPVNPPIYERFGFETVAHVADAAWLPGLWIMRREPQVV